MSEFEENTVKEFDDTKYEELVGKYIEYKEKEKINKELKDCILNEIDAMMHIERTDYKKVYVSAIDAEWEAKYIDRNTKKTDYVRLAEVVSSSVFNEIVTDSSSSYLKISAVPKPKGKRERPIVKAPDIKIATMPKAKIMGQAKNHNGHTIPGWNSK
jgi:hypothetical protein